MQGIATKEPPEPAEADTLKSIENPNSKLFGEKVHLMSCSTPKCQGVDSSSYIYHLKKLLEIMEVDGVGGQLPCERRDTSHRPLRSPFRPLRPVGRSHQGLFGELGREGFLQQRVHRMLSEHPESSGPWLRFFGDVFL